MVGGSSMEFSWEQCLAAVKFIFGYFVLSNFDKNNRKID